MKNEKKNYSFKYFWNNLIVCIKTVYLWSKRIINLKNYKKFITVVFFYIYVLSSFSCFQDYLFFQCIWYWQNCKTAEIWQHVNVKDHDCNWYYKKLQAMFANFIRDPKFYKKKIQTKTQLFLDKNKNFYEKMKFGCQNYRNLLMCACASNWCLYILFNVYFFLFLGHSNKMFYLVSRTTKFRKYLAASFHFFLI